MFLLEFVRSDPQNCHYNQIFVDGVIDPFLKLCVVALPRVPTRSGSRSLLPSDESSVVTRARIPPATSNLCAPWLAPPPPGVLWSPPIPEHPTSAPPERSLLPSLTGQPPSAQPLPSPQGTSRFKLLLLFTHGEATGMRYMAIRYRIVSCVAGTHPRSPNWAASSRGS